MPQLLGSRFTRKQLLARLGDISQVASISEERLVSGGGDGMRQLSFRTGSGLSFSVLPDRGMDLAGADYRGIPLAWRSPVGWVAPSHYDPRGRGWMKSFGGGLMVTCGLTQVGPPAVDGPEELGMHGRISNTPATDITARGAWEEDDYVLDFSGRVLDGTIELRRSIRTSLAAPSVTIRDQIGNGGTAPAPLMVLYHFNLGYPLVSEGARVVVPPCRSEPRDPGTPIDQMFTFDAPIADVDEQVFYHELDGNAGEALIGLVNDRLIPGGPIAFYIRYGRSTLPFLVQWKHQGTGMNVLGLEPANCHVEGRPAERRRGTLQMLEPGEIVNTSLEWGVVEGADRVEELFRS